GPAVGARDRARDADCRTRPGPGASAYLPRPRQPDRERVPARDVRGRAPVGPQGGRRPALRPVHLGPGKDPQGGPGRVPDAAPEGERSMRPRNAAPIMTLLVLSPLIGEVLSGATRLSFIFVLVPEIRVWGCGTLIIGDVVRRWRGGGPSALLLGLGLAIAEEFIIQQTSLAPLPWLDPATAYGRVAGVNWPYFLFMLGY